MLLCKGKISFKINLHIKHAIELFGRYFLPDVRPLFISGASNMRPKITPEKLSK